MRKIIGIALTIFLIQSCTAEPDKPFTTEVPVFTDALTLELSFGDENVPDEFLLARPMGLDVNNDGDIYIADEERLKVFDENGTPKTIIGGPGEGPGEFRMLMDIGISPSGYIAAGTPTEYNLFSPKNEFIRKYDILRSPISKILVSENVNIPASTSRLYMISKNEFVLTGSGSKRTEDDPEASYRVLVHVLDDSVSVLAEYKDVQRIVVDEIPTTIQLLGDFQWGLLSGNRVVFTHSAYDKRDEQNNSYYILNVVSLDTGERTDFSTAYEKTEIADSIIAKQRWRGISAMDTDREKLNKIVRDKVKELKYFPPIMNILTDNKYVFAFLYHNNYESESIAHVIDVNSGKHISTIHLPFVPIQIKNGYAYRIKSGPDIFPVVEKYKINPAVYGK
ncbi:hypothetical protein AMJ80_09920 [bacterium SM23_31]|nr:MAG: hypothetical protein AMJ80_09920 [bacterium SM23_31]